MKGKGKHEYKNTDRNVKYIYLYHKITSLDSKSKFKKIV